MSELRKVGSFLGCFLYTATTWDIPQQCIGCRLQIALLIDPLSAKCARGAVLAVSHHLSNILP